MTDYRAELASHTAPAVIADHVARAKAIYAGPVGRWIDKYKGGFPAGYAAAAIQWESDGIATTVGDPSLGEYGFFQVTAEFPTTIGLPSAARMDPETNVFLGLMEYQMEAIRQSLSNPLVQLGTIDAWKLARLSFAIGSAGTRNLIANAHPTQRGQVFDAVRAYVDNLGAYDQIWYRVHTTDVVWDIGVKVAPFQTWGNPTLVPDPPTGAYALPAAVASFFSKPISPVVIVAALGLGYLIWRRFA
jgi:hypothetical protein